MITRKILLSETATGRPSRSVPGETMRRSIFLLGISSAAARAAEPARISESFMKGIKIVDQLKILRAFANLLKRELREQDWYLYLLVRKATVVTSSFQKNLGLSMLIEAALLRLLNHL